MEAAMRCVQWLAGIGVAIGVTCGAQAADGQVCALTGNNATSYCVATEWTVANAIERLWLDRNHESLSEWSASGTVWSKHWGKGRAAVTGLDGSVSQFNFTFHEARPPEGFAYFYVDPDGIYFDGLED